MPMDGGKQRARIMNTWQFKIWLEDPIGSYFRLDVTKDTAVGTILKEIEKKHPPMEGAYAGKPQLEWTDTSTKVRREEREREGDGEGEERERRFHTVECRHPQRVPQCSRTLTAPHSCVLCHPSLISLHPPHLPPSTPVFPGSLR